MPIAAISRRLFVGSVFALALPAGTAGAATPAEDFISGNIQKGLGILNARDLAAPERSQQFETLLLNLINMKRVAIFTLGSYAATAPQADQDAFSIAFQAYSIAVYRSYLGRYAGQTLMVTGSSQRAPDDFIVNTNMLDPHGGSPLAVDFRVRTDTGKPELTDVNVMGVWLALSQRDQFGAFLSKNGGSVIALTDHVRAVTSQYR